METQVKVDSDGQTRTRVIKGGHLFVACIEGLYIDSEEGRLWLVALDPRTEPTINDANVLKLRPAYPGTFDVTVTHEGWTEKRSTNVTRIEAAWLIQEGWAKVEPRVCKHRETLRWHKVSSNGDTFAAQVAGGCLVQVTEYGSEDAAPGVGLVFIPGATLDDIAPEQTFEVTGMEEE